jgi:beta-glucanase (GH16 family)
MKAIHPALILIACLGMSACSKGDTAPDGTASDEAFDGINAGKWDVRSQLSSMDQSQLDAIGEERAQEMMGEERSAQMCLEYSERTKPPVGMFYSSAETCSYDSFSMSGGRISATLKCASDKGEPTRLSGRYDNKAYSVTITKTLADDSGEPGERTFVTSGRFKGTC